MKTCEIDWCVALAREGGYLCAVHSKHKDHPKPDVSIELIHRYNKETRG